MEKHEIDRINELARKKKTVGLTEAELQEQAELRKRYLAELRAGVQRTLDRVYVQQEDGSYQKLRKKTDPERQPEGTAR